MNVLLRFANIDVTKVPGQEGLWCNVLMAASLLWLMNISDFASPLQPLAVTFGKVRKAYAVCDPSKLGELVEGSHNYSGALAP